MWERASYGPKVYGTTDVWHREELFGNTHIGTTITLLRSGAVYGCQSFGLRFASLGEAQEMVDKHLIMYGIMLCNSTDEEEKVKLLL